jgi:hypothetical protein
MNHEQYLNLERSFIGIRDERNYRANTATRIGTAFLELLRMVATGEFDEVTFNSVSNKPTFLQGLLTYGSIILGDYIKGLQGGIITEEAFAELKELWVREHVKVGDGTIHKDAAGRTMPALEVDGDAVFSGNLSSPDFVSGFFSGLGWAIQKKEFVNSLGQTETKYTFEIDNLTVRNTLRVFELIVSQLRGENDNFVFAAMMEVDHYDPLTGKVWLSTNGGKSYMNFREGDCIMVQRFQPGNDAKSGGDGYIVKSYELVIYDCGSGGEGDPKDENGDRLDWVLFKNFATQMVDDNPSSTDEDYVGTYYTEEEIAEMGKDGESPEPVFMTPERLIAKGDTFCRVDNETDPERKGVMSITSVGPNTPYMDVMYGMKTDPKHALKSRIGNLEGIRTEAFGWLQGFGAYINNLYAVGNLFNSQTGESYESRIEATRESMKMLYRETLYDISEGENKVANGFFQKGLDNWSLVNLEGDAIPDEPEVECGQKYTDPTTGKETVDWFLQGGTGEEDTDGMAVSDGATVEVGNGEMGVPLLFNGQVIQQKRLIAEMKTVEGVQVLHLCNAGVSQDFSVMKPNSAHKKLTVDDDEFENPSKPDNSQPEYEKMTYRYWEDYYRDWLVDNYDYDDWRIEEVLSSETAINWINQQVASWSAYYESQVDYLTSTEDEADKLYFGIRILPLTDGVLRVGFLGKNELWSESSGFSESLISSSSWVLRQACDYPEDGRAWYFPLDTDKFVKNGRLLVSFSGECYIRFVAVSSDPISEAEREYKTLFEQNSRRIRMQASRDEQEYADWVIQYNAIAQRVTDNKNLADKALKDILGIEYDGDSGTYIFPDDWVNNSFTFASWIIHTKNRLDFLFTKWDDDENLVGYSDRSQTADFIREVIAGTADDPLWGEEGRNLVEAFSSFKLAWNEALSDGTIDARERATLDELKKAMATAFSQANAFYDKALLNPIMGSTDELADLKKKWNTLTGKYSELNDAIDAVLAVNGYIDVNDRHKDLVTAVESAYTAFNNAVKAFYESLAVANNYVDGELAKRVKTVQDNLTGYQQSLDREIQKAFPNKTFINWISDTKTSSMQVLGMISLDNDGNPVLTDYSLKTQTATAIEEAVSTSKGYAEGQVKALKDIIHPDVLKKNNNDYDYATFKTQTSNGFDTIAAAFDPKTKKLSKISTWVQTVEGFEERVENIEGLSIIKQTATAIQNVITGDYIGEKIGIDDYAKVNDLPDMSKYYAKSDFEMTPSQIKQSVEGLERKVIDISRMEDWEQGFFGTTAGKDYVNIKSDNSNWIRTKNLIGITKFTAFTLKNGYMMYVGFFNSVGTLLSRSSMIMPSDNKTSFKPDIPSNAAYCAITITKAGQPTTVNDLPGAGLYKIDSSVVTGAEISMFVSKDSNGYLESGIKLRADQISITTIDQFGSDFSWTTMANKLKGKITIAAKDLLFDANNITWTLLSNWTIRHPVNNSTEDVLKFTASSGDLWIKGKLSAGSKIGDSVTINNNNIIVVGEDSEKLYIRPKGTNGAEIVGISGTVETLKFGFISSEIIDGSEAITHPSLEMKTGATGGYLDTKYTPKDISFHDNATGAWLRIGTMRGFNGKGKVNIISASWARQENYDDLLAGQVYVDNNGYLKVK